MFKQDAQGYNLIIKRFLIATLGFATYFRYRYNFKVDVQGYENLKDLPKERVLFVSNHQTYFAEVILFYHILCGFKNNRKKILGVFFTQFNLIGYFSSFGTFEGHIVQFSEMINFIIDIEYIHVNQNYIFAANK